MQNLFSGYVELNGKKCRQSLKDPSAYLDEFHARRCWSYGGVLAPDTILIDVDDSSQADLLQAIIEDEGIKCAIVATSRGKHFYFTGYPKTTKCRVHARLACGLDADIKVGSKLTYGVLKLDGAERTVVANPSACDPLPSWLRPVAGSPDVIGMGDGSGRNQALFNYILELQAEGFTRDEARETLRVINSYVFETPMPKRELDSVCRDEAFADDVFYQKGVFLFDKFASYMQSEHRIVKISGKLHIYDGRVYVPNDAMIEHAMIEHLPRLSRAKRKEVLDYLDVAIQVDTKTADADKIAFANGVYDLQTHSLRAFSPDDVITNLIPWDYNPDAWSDVAYSTMRKLACGDDEVYELLEEVIGYTFYRRNELRKCFILLGDKANGKSTYLDMLKTLLGDNNVCALDIAELGERFKTAELFGRLANIGDDIGDEFIANPAVFKKLVSGDRVNAERKGKDPFDFSSYAKLLFSANTMPRIKDKTGAVIDRLVLVPFNATFSKSDPDFDPYIKYKLHSDEVMSHLINRGLFGLERVLTNQAFTQPTRVKVELAQYAEFNNPELEYFHDKPREEVVNQPTSLVYDDYGTWAMRNNVKSLGQNEFTRRASRYYGLTSVTKRVDFKRIRIFVEG